MRIAIVHDYLNQKGGAERVVGVLHQMYPDAPIYTLFADPDKMWPSLGDATIRESILRYFPFIRRHFKLFFWLYPLAMKSVRIPSDYDVVISSSSAYAKGFSFSQISRPVHICYCYTPMRFAWDFNRYIEKETSYRALKMMARVFVSGLKKWDLRTSKRVDEFVAISSVVKKRIKEIYSRDATIIFPPVELSPYDGDSRDQGYYLVVSRLVSYKRIDLAVEACSQLGARLLVIGEGVDRERLQTISGPTVQFLGWQPDNSVKEYMKGCTAFIFPGEEDFGMTPVEVNSLGRPVVAYKAGGALDTITDGVNGVFFDEPSVSSLKAALTRLEQMNFDTGKIVGCAHRFSRELFEQTLRDVIDDTFRFYGAPSRGEGAAVCKSQSAGMPSQVPEHQRSK